MPDIYHVYYKRVAPTCETIGVTRINGSLQKIFLKLKVNRLYSVIQLCVTVTLYILILLGSVQTSDDSRKTGRRTDLHHNSETT